MWRDIVRYSYEGLDKMEIADCVGVTYHTLCKWLKMYPKLAEQCHGAKLSGGKKLVEYGLFKLARGSESITEEASWVEIDNQGRTIKKSRTVSKSRPDLKAIQTLAKKYAKEYSEIQEENGNLNININTLSMREVMELRDNSYATQHHRLRSDEDESERLEIPPYSEKS